MFAWLATLPTTTDGKMKKDDLKSAVAELLKMKKIDEEDLPSCFTKRNMEGFKKNLEQKGESFTKE